MSTTRTPAQTPVRTAPRTTPLREKMRADLQIAGLSERTQEAYLRAVRQLAEHLRTPPDQITEEQLREYFLFLRNEKRFAPASLKPAPAKAGDRLLRHPVLLPPHCPARVDHPEAAEDPPA